MSKPTVIPRGDSRAKTLDANNSSINNSSDVSKLSTMKSQLTQSNTLGVNNNSSSKITNQTSTFGGDKLEMTDHQKILVQKELLKPKSNMQGNIRQILRGQIDDHTSKFTHIEEEHRRLRQMDLEEKERIRMEKIKKNLAMSDANNGIVT